MIATTLAQVAAATGGVPVGDAPVAALVTGVTTDSREVVPGDLFVAIVGDHHDGHDHAAEAVAAGAVAVLGQRATGTPCLLVADTVHALGLLAADVLSRLQAGGPLEVVGITGSIGKTSTKDLLGQVLARLGPTVAAAGSYNNEIGLPTTVLRCDEQTRYLVLELGSRGLGHISRLTAIARPRIGVVLNVGSAHVGEFGSLAATAQAKGELVQALPAAAAGGVAVLNADDPLVTAMAARTTAQVRRFGNGADADVRATDVRLDAAARPSFVLHAATGSEQVSLTLHGTQSVSHALAAATVALALGMGLSEVAGALSSAVAVSAGRMSVAENADGVTIVDDAYNASPESVAAALRALMAMAGTGAAARRTWAVLGEMRELGASSVTEHVRIGRLAARLGVSRLVTVGDGAAPIRRGSAGQGTETVSVPDVAAAVQLLRREVRTGDVVLVKASRAVGLDRVAAGLLAPADRAEGES